LAQEITVPVDQPADWTSDAVLNACRAWRRVLSGHWSDKVTAGREVTQAAIGQFEADDNQQGIEREVVDQAVAVRDGAAGPLVGQAREFQRGVLVKLQRAAG